MTGPADTPFQPNWTSRPGATIADILNERQGWPAFLAAGMAALGAEVTLGLLDGTTMITPPVAAFLAAQLGSTERFWLARDAHFRADTARLAGAPLTALTVVRLVLAWRLAGADRVANQGQNQEVERANHALNSLTIPQLDALLRDLADDAGARAARDIIEHLRLAFTRHPDGTVTFTGDARLAAEQADALAEAYLVDVQQALWLEVEAYWKAGFLRGAKFWHGREEPGTMWQSEQNECWTAARELWACLPPTALPDARLVVAATHAEEGS